MITFKQMCEMLTCNQRYSWFYLPSECFSSLTIEEKAQLYTEHEQEIRDYYRCWFPKEKFFIEQDRRLKHDLEIAQQELSTLQNEIFPDDLPTMNELISKRISADLKDQFAEVRAIDKLIRLRARKDAL